MSVDISDLLRRRTDLSTFVVHLTRSTGQLTAEQRLGEIVRTRRLVAWTPMGWAKGMDDPSNSQRQSQRVVCFSETPLEHVYALVGDIANRQVKLEPYGLALTKLVARRVGVNPVWYVSMRQDAFGDWTIVKALDALRDWLVDQDGQGLQDFHASYLARLFPFIEQMGAWRDRPPKEFWWEREWRHVGDVKLDPVWNSIIWLCREEWIEHLRREIADNAIHGDREPVVIDPRWSLEQIVAQLAGIPPSAVDPFLPIQ